MTGQQGDEGDDRAMAADAPELARFLNEMLEAERAGARVSLDSFRHAGDARLAGLMQRIHRDEAKWCAMLSRHLTALGVTPSTRTGAFYDKAMAIADPGDRLAFLNRGQGWVVRKLGEMMPRVQDEALRADLGQMREAHVANIAVTNSAIT